MSEHGESAVGAFGADAIDSAIRWRRLCLRTRHVMLVAVRQEHGDAGMAWGTRTSAGAACAGA